MYDAGLPLVDRRSSDQGGGLVATVIKQTGKFPVGFQPGIGIYLNWEGRTLKWGAVFDEKLQVANEQAIYEGIAQALTEYLPWAIQKLQERWKDEKKLKIIPPGFLPPFKE